MCECLTVQMPKLKERRRRHRASKKLPKEKEFSSHADIKPTSGRSQSKSNGHLDLPLSSQGPRIVISSSVVSANWKNLAKVSKIRKTGDFDV